MSSGLWPTMEKQGGEWFDAFRDAGGDSAPKEWTRDMLMLGLKLGHQLKKPMVFPDYTRDQSYPATIGRELGQDVSIFYSNSGAEAVEAAIKLARKATGRRWIVGMQDDFHGRSLGTLGLYGGGPDYYHKGFAPYDAKMGWLCDCCVWVHRHKRNARMVPPSNVAAFVISPVLGQATLECQPNWAWEYAKQVREAGGLIIFDEVQTGFGRAGGVVSILGTGTYLRPDIWCFGKAAGGGFPLSLTVCSPELATDMDAGTHFNTMAGSPLGIWMSLQFITELKNGWLRDALEYANELYLIAPKRIVQVGYMMAVHSASPQNFINTMRARGVFVLGRADKPTRISLPFGMTDGEKASFKTILKRTLEDVR